MGNYNTKCEITDCRTHIRKLEKDVFHCKHHRCAKTLCNLSKEEDINYCSHHK